MKILIIGGGNMGRTYADSFLANHSVQKDDLYILEHFEDKINVFKSLGFNNVFYQAGEYIRDLQLIILAVKPQDCAELLPKVAPFINENHLVLSIMAGVRIATLQAALPGTQKFVRAMPNLPAQIGMGMTGFTSAESVGKEELFRIHNLLNTTGKSIYFDEESKLDAVTAISGSGPAYVYYFMDAVIKSAREMGFTEEQAELLTEQTFLGAVHLQNRNSLSCEEWIRRVSSRGGTTEAAVKSFGENDLQKLIAEGLDRALRRAGELGN